MTFCHNDFFFQPVSCEMQFQKTVTSFMQFQKNVTSFMCSFKKLSPVSCSFKKMSLVSCLVSKKNVKFVCSRGETIRHFAKKNTITGGDFDSLQKNFFSSFKMLKLCPIFFFWRIFLNFFFSKTFSQICNFESTFYVIFFFFFSKLTLLQRLLSNSNETESSFTETI